MTIPGAESFSQEQLIYDEFCPQSHPAWCARKIIEFRAGSEKPSE